MATRRQTGGVSYPRLPPQVGGNVRPTVNEEFSPVSEWKQQEQSQLLLVYLHGFAKEQIKVEVSTIGANTLRVRGEHQLGGNKRRQFQEEFRIPEECNIKGIRAKFEDGTLTITMPNKTSELAQVGPTKEEAKTTNREAPPRPADQLPPKTISTASEAKKTDGKRITEETSSQKVATEPPKPQKGQGETPPKPASSMDSAKPPADGKGVRFTTAAKIIPETTETKERSLGKGNLVEVKKPEKIALEKTEQKEKEEITKKGKELLKAENLIEKIVKKEKDESGGTAGVDKGRTAGFADVAKEKETTDYVTSTAAASGSGGGDSDEGLTLDKCKQAMKGLVAKGGNLNEERQLIVNMGVAILVIVALGAYISYTVGSSGETEN